MDRIPLGVSGLDARIGGGAPAGSVVLLAGEAGAGSREFMYTCAVMNALAATDRELFELYYGEDLAADVPPQVHFVSFTAADDDIREEMTYAMDEAVVESGVEAIDFADLSEEYFQLSPVPREWYAPHHTTIESLGDSSNRRNVIESLADYLDANAEESLLVVDALTDLTAVRNEDLEWSDVVFLVKGLRRACRSWGGLVLLHASTDSLTDTQMGDLMESVDGTMLFEWESGGNERDRTLVVRDFRGVLSQLEAEDIVRFETEIHEGGFDISNVRKIR